MWLNVILNDHLALLELLGKTIFFSDRRYYHKKASHGLVTTSQHQNRDFQKMDKWFQSKKINSFKSF